MASYRRPWPTLLVLGLLVTLAVWQARKLTVDADLTGLLPKSFQSIQDLEELQERFGSTGWVTVAAEGAEPDQLIRFVEDLAPRLNALEHVQYVDHTRESTFFEERMLYFLSVEDLGIVRDRIQERVDYEKQRHNPLFMALDDGPPPLDFSDLAAKYMGPDTDTSWTRKESSSPYYLNEKDRFIVLQVKPDSNSIDLTYTRELLDGIQGEIDAMDLASYGPDLKVSLAGRYKARMDLQNAIENDLGVVSILATLALLGYLAIHFRRLLAVVLIMAPLMTGMALTFGFAGTLFGILNILTAFIGAILLGLGVDHGIHLLARFEQEHGSGRGGEEAVRITFGNTGRGVVVAAITTTMAFFSLAMSEFRAFFEFGILAGVGLTLVVASYTLCLPALLSVALRFGWRARKVEETQDDVRWPQRVRRHRGKLLVVSAVALVMGVMLAPGASFNYDFAALDQVDEEARRINFEIMKVMGMPDGAVAILTKDTEEERLVAEQLRELQRKPGSTIKMVAASSDLLPANQLEKRRLLDEIAQITDGITPAAIEDAEARQQFEELQVLLRAQPFTREELPRQVKLLFGGQNEGAQGFVMVFGSVGGAHGLKLLSFAKELRSIRTAEGTTPPIAGEDIVLADILSMVMREALPISLMAMVTLLVTIWLLLARLREALLCLLPALLTLLFTLALMNLTGLRANYLNIVLFPILFGISVDGGVHMVTRLTSGGKFDAVVGETARAIVGALLTTALSFAALTLAHHAGLQSMGKLALLGLVTNYLVCMVPLPVVLALLFARRKPNEHTDVEAEPTGLPEARLPPAS